MIRPWVAKGVAIAGSGLLGFLVALYLAQETLVAPQEMDEGLCLELIELLARGQRPNVDLVDAYGPLQYAGPALFWKLAGGKVWGVRLWVLMVKLLTAGLGTWVVARLAGYGWALVGLFLSTVLLGLPWQTLQTPYAMLHCAPLILATYGLLVVRPFRRGLNEALAGVCTAAALLIKVSAGGFLLAGVVLYALCIAPEKGAPRPWIRWGRWALLGLCVAVFLLYVADKPDRVSYLYFDLPLLVAAAWVAMGLRRDDRAGRGASLRPVGIYLLVTASILVVVLALTLGWSAPSYFRETLTLVSSLDYVRPFRLPGQTGVYPDYGRYLWPELPWLGLALFVLWWALGDGSDRAPASRQVGGLWVMTTLGGFVLRALATEIHAVGAAWTTAPAVVVVIAAAMRRFAQRSRTRGVPLPQIIAGALLVGWSLTLFERPTLGRLVPRQDFSVRPGRPKSDNRLAGLRFREATARGEWEGLFPDAAYQRDRDVDEAAKFIDSITTDGEAVLNTTRSHILHLHSFTQHVGGRYRFLFYMAHTGLLDREALERLAPGLLRSLLTTPPRVIISSRGYVSPLLEQVPELRQLSRRFAPVRTFGSILILVRKDVTLPEEAKR